MQFKNTLTFGKFIDGASNGLGCGTGIVVESPDVVVAKCALRFEFKASNNKAKYEPVTLGLNITKNIA